MKSKTGYFEVLNGCAGDMLVGSLIDAGLSLPNLKRELSKIPLDDYEIKIKKVKRKTHFNHFLQATQFLVKVKREKDITPYSEIINLIEKSKIKGEYKSKIKNIFEILAKAEAVVHGENIENIHFHQVGQIDAIVEISSFVIGLDLLGIEKVFSSAVGISNPAPATVEMMKNIPVVFKSVPYEITTPTGIAILKGMCNFEIPENFYVEKEGYGAGERNEPFPNVVKFFIGEERKEKEEIIVVETNIDDFSPVFAGYVIDKLKKAGALDVVVFTGTGKKNRPIFKLEVLTPEEKFKEIVETIFKETTTIGLRFRKEKRIVLEREISEVKTKWGSVRIKTTYFNGKKVNISPEFEDCKKIAEEKKVSLKDVYMEIFKKLK